MESPIWRPFTQMKGEPPPPLVTRGQGVWLELADGRKILDAISSWWVTIHGHAHPALAEALYAQAQELEQVIFAGFTHPKAEKLATQLLAHLPPPLKRVFFSDNGSTAVEVALKMAFQYWQNLGESQRTTFIAFAGGYHGDTLGAMSVGRGSVWWQTFNPLLLATELVPFPATFWGDEMVEATEAETLSQITALLESKGEQIIGIFIEPLVQGAAGMRMCRPQFLQALETLTKKFNVLLIYDEVMTGFGRTGQLFACLKSATCPDLLCLSKGLSGGCLPLAVTVAQEKIYQAFYSDLPQAAFYHGHSYTGNPLACATGVVSLEMLAEHPEYYQRLEVWHQGAFSKWLEGNPRLEHFRLCGTIAAMDIKTTEEGYFQAIAPRLKAAFLEAGVLLRPLGNTIYILPPYCITQAELDWVYQAIAQVLDVVT
jgi:adenosylmethionine-8-amino-7-oxononanoate aminotransferase